MVFKSYGTVYHGAGITIEAFAKIFNENGYDNPLLIYDNKAINDKILMHEYKGMYSVDCQHEPTYGMVEKLYELMSKKWISKCWDVIVAVGGGSTLDVAKVISVLITNDEPPRMLKGFDKVKNKGIPVIAVPTTLSGSEATNNASLIDEIEKVKMGINGRHMFAEYAILDPSNLPKDKRIYTMTWLDAVTHAYESLVCKQANYLTMPYSQEALKILLENNIDTVQIGAYMAGRALCNSGSGIAGALSYPFGVHYCVPHGIACGIWLPDVMEFNGHDDYAQQVRETIFEAGISVNLEDYGVKNDSEFFDKVKHLQKAFDQNKKTFTLNDCAEMIKKHFKEKENAGLGSSGERRKAESAGTHGKRRSRVRARV